MKSSLHCFLHVHPALLRFSFLVFNVVLVAGLPGVSMRLLDLKVASPKSEDVYNVDLLITLGTEHS